MPEQTRAAFAAAFALGVDGVECDVRLTADDEIVCHHDATVDRTSNGVGAVGDFTLADLRALDWRTDPGQGIVTLAELLDIAAASARPVSVAVELKHPNPSGTRLDERVIDMLAGFGWDASTSACGNVSIDLMTFNPESVPVLARSVDPRHIIMLTTAASVDDVAYALDDDAADAATSTELQQRLDAALSAGRALIDDGMVGGAGPDLDLVRREPETVRRWISRGLRVRVWTVDDHDDLLRCLDLGITDIETDQPEAMLRMLGR